MSHLIHQLVHGYRRGHQLLAGSTQLDVRSSDLVARLSDLSGTLISDVQFAPYLTSYPLPGGAFYALGKTWLDTEAPRTGCVLTHTLLIPMGLWGQVSEPRHFEKLFARPLTSDQSLAYVKAPLSFSESTSFELVEPDFKMPVEASEFVTRYFSEGLRPIVWFGLPSRDGVFWHILRALWPRLRQEFAACTYSLNPRALDDRPFDILFAPTEAYGRYRALQRENIIGDSTMPDSPRHTGNDEPWIKRWTRSVFGQEYVKGRSGSEFEDFRVLLSSEPTAIRKLYIMNDMRHRAETSPLAAVGLMDMVEALAPEGEQALSYKQLVVKSALDSVETATDEADALRYYLLVGERLRHSAFSQINDKLVRRLEKAVAEQTLKAPDRALDGGERLLAPYPLDGPSPFVKGLAAGLFRLGKEAPDQLGVLRRYPLAAPRLIVIEPGLARAYLRAARSGSAEAQASDLVRWIRTISDVAERRLVRDHLLPDIRSAADAPLVDELLKSVTAAEIEPVLDVIALSTDGAWPPQIGLVLAERVAQAHPAHARDWVFRSRWWSNAVASLGAATYPYSDVGLTELLAERVDDTGRCAAVLAEYLRRVAQMQSVAWPRERIYRDPVVWTRLLANGRDTSLEVGDVIKYLLRDTQELPIDEKHLVPDQILPHLYLDHGPSLVDAAMRNALVGYIRGEHDLSLLESWLSTDWSAKWLNDIGDGDLEALISMPAYKEAEAWYRVWTWLADAPDTVYARSPSVLPRLTQRLSSIQRWDWTESITEAWIQVLVRAEVTVTLSVNLQLNAEALDFALSHTHYPLGQLAAEAFNPVYAAVTSSRSLPPETRVLFHGFEWDRGKELRRRIVDAFLQSKWRPGDLALAVRKDESLLRKIVKRVMQNWKGEDYIEAMLVDLSKREGQGVDKVRRGLAELQRSPNFHEPWI